AVKGRTTQAIIHSSPPRKNSQPIYSTARTIRPIISGSLLMGLPRCLYRAWLSTVGACACRTLASHAGNRLLSGFASATPASRPGRRLCVGPFDQRGDHTRQIWRVGARVVVRSTNNASGSCLSYRLKGGAASSPGINSGVSAALIFDDQSPPREPYTEPPT